ncbi:MAG: ChaN family lipoprotein [Rhodospirillales bacterium]
MASGSIARGWRGDGRRRTAAVAAIAMVLWTVSAVASAAPSPPCSTSGTWVDPATGAAVAHDDVIARHARGAVVLLGEDHHDARHHRWQLHTIAALHGRRPDIVLGFEMFPRDVQPTLDRWVAGELTPEAFLREAGWVEVWGIDADLYLPLFLFARQHRVPMVALNVDRALIARVGRDGWSAVAAADRQGLSDPAPASEDYRRALAEVFAMKRRHGAAGAAAGADGSTDPALLRFVEAQLTWDRAMAEAIAGARRSGGDPLVVGIVGRGHAEHRWGIPHQLAALGIADVAVLLPIAPGDDCAAMAPDVADAVFVVERGEDPDPSRPRLGVRVETTEAGVRIDAVVEGGIAAAAGIRAGDIVVAAAGYPVARSGDLIEIVGRQAPGTWLPVTLRRDGATLEVVARFPRGGDAER